MTQTPPSQPHDTKDSSTSGAASRLRDNAKEATAFWYDRQHRELLFYLSVAIFFLELVVGAVAFFYGVIHAEPGLNGGPPRFQFPWLGYVLAAVLLPTALLLIVHLAGVGLFRSLRGKEATEEWQKDLPERLRKVYAIIQGAPTVVLLLGILLLGVALFYFDGAMSALLRLGQTAEKYLPWIIGGVVAAWCVGYVARIWLNYRTRHMEAEYAFRREVLERTGVIIVDRGGMQLPPAGATLDPARALQEAAHPEEPQDADPLSDLLPQGAVGKASKEDTQGPVLDVTPENKPGGNPPPSPAG